MFAHSFSHAFCPSGWARVSWAFCFFALLCLMLPRTASAQTLPPPSPTSIEQNLLNILQTCQQLRPLLQNQGKLSAEQIALLQQAQKQLQTSAAQIATLQGQLDSSQASVKDSQAEMSRLSTLLAASQDSLKQLSTDFEALKAQRDQDVLNLQGERDKAEELARNRAIFRHFACIGTGAAAGSIAGKGNLADAGIGAGAGLVLDLFLGWIGL